METCDDSLGDAFSFECGKTRGEWGVGSRGVGDMGREGGRGRTHLTFDVTKLDVIAAAFAGCCACCSDGVNTHYNEWN